MKHSDLVNLCMMEISKLGMCWANATGAIKVDDRFLRYGKPGSSDILACISGRFVGVECKCGRDKVRKNQQNFGTALERAGGIYIVARSVDDVRNRLTAEGLI